MPLFIITRLIKILIYSFDIDDAIKWRTVVLKMGFIGKSFVTLDQLRDR